MEVLKDKLITWIAGGFALFIQVASPSEWANLAEQVNMVLEEAARANLEAHILSLQRQEMVRTVGVFISLIVLLLVNWAAIVLRLCNIKIGFGKIWEFCKTKLKNWKEKFCLKTSQCHWLQWLKKKATPFISKFFKH